MKVSSGEIKYIKKRLDAFFSLIFENYENYLVKSFLRTFKSEREGGSVSIIYDNDALYDAFKKIATEDDESSVRKFVNTVRRIGEVLRRKHREVIVPQEMIIVPRVPFTKKTAVPWGWLQDLNQKDKEKMEVYMEMKYKTQKAGNLINCGFLLKNFTLVDIDLIREDSSKRKVLEERMDVRTRRGYHKIFYHPQAIATATIWGKDALLRRLINLEKSLGLKIEIMSGVGFLGSYPEMSRYLDVGKGIKIKKYNVLSRELKAVTEVGDLTQITVEKPEEIKNFITDLLGELGGGSIAKNIESNLKVEFIKDYEEVKEQIKTTSRELGRTPSVGKYGLLSYRDFIVILEKRKSKLPPCVRIGLLEGADEGFRYAFARHVCTIVPAFVCLDEKSLKELIKDIAKKYGFRRPKDYYWKFYTGFVKMWGSEIRTLGKPYLEREVYDIVYQKAGCDSCPYRHECIMYMHYKEKSAGGRHVYMILRDILEEDLKDLSGLENRPLKPLDF